MFLQQLWFLVITSTLLLQCCIADESLSTLKTSSDRSSYSNAETQSSNVEIASDSFSKSDSSLSVSQSEVSQNESSLVNTNDGISLQDSSYHSSSSNLSSSDSNIIASDGFISQTDSNFAASSSSTAESDSSLTVTPNATVSSSTQSSTTSTTSSSATTSLSINKQFLDDGVADISFPDDFPHIGSTYQTKSLDSISDFPNNSLHSKTFPESSNSKYPPSLGFRSFPELPPSFPSISNSVNNEPTLPSDLLPNNPLQNDNFPSSGPKFLNVDTPTTFLDSDLNSPMVNPLYDTQLISPLPKDLPIVPDSLNDNSILDNISLPNHSPTMIDSSSLDVIQNTRTPHSTESVTNFLENDIPLEEFPTPEFPNSFHGEHPVTPYDSLMHSSENNDIPIEFYSEDIGIPIIDDFDTNSSFTQFPSHQPYDLLKDSSNSRDDVSTPKAPHDFDLHPDYLASDQYSNLTTLESVDTNKDGLIFPEEILESSNTTPKILDNGLISPEEILPLNNALVEPIHPDGHPTTLQSMDTNQDGSISPEEVLESSNAAPKILDNGFISPEEILDSPKTLDSTYMNQNGLMSPEEILLSNNAFVESIHPGGHPTTLQSMDTNQDGLISPKQILETNNLSVESTISALDNDIESPKIPDSTYFPLPGHDDSVNLPGNTEYLNSEFSPDGWLPHFPHRQSLPYQPNSGYIYPQKSRFTTHNQPSRPHGPFKPKPLLPTYPWFYKPTPLGYHGPKNPVPFPHNDMSFLKQSSPFSKYPSYSSHLKNELLAYPSSYGSPMMPSLNDYHRNFLKPLPLFHHPLIPNLYPPLSAFPPGNPFLNKPLYPYSGVPFGSMQRTHYAPKNWSKIPSSKHSQIPQFLDSTSNPLSPLPADLDSLPHDQPAFDLPPDSVLLQSSNDLPVLDSPLDQPSSLPQSPYNLPVPSSLPLESSYNLPILESPLDQSSSLPPSVYDLPVPGPSLDQPSISSDSNIDLPFEVPISSPFNSLNDDSLSTEPYNFSPTVIHSPSLSASDFDKNSPSTELDLPSLGSSPAYSSIDEEMFKILKQQYERTITAFQLSNSIYPRDIASDFDTMTNDELSFNFVVLGSSPAALSALKTLAEMGKSILLVERGSLPPHISKSLYYRPKILQSDYVRRIKSSAPHCDAEKVLYAPNVLGEESTYDSNAWDYGARSKYIKWGKLCPKWTWNNVIQYFSDDSNKLYTCAIPVTTEIDSTKAVDTITSIFNDAKIYRTEHQKGERLKGLTVMPHLQENGENIILAENIFRQLTSYTNIQLALKTIADSIIFDDTGKAIGVVVKTPCGATKTITILDELIIGSNPIDTVKFLYQSGIGDHEKLQQLNIPTQINLPYVGKELIITPLHFGAVYLFPQGTLLSDQESDFAGMNYLFGKYGLSPASAVDYFKAAVNIYGSHEANVVFNFRAFSKSMYERLNSYIESLTYIDGKIKDFLNNLCQEYDILLAIPQLTNVLSRGEIIIDNSSGEFEVFVNTGMYKSKRDMKIMQKALKVLKSIAETETFKSMNGKVVQIPVEKCGIPDFSTEYNECSIRYLSLPNLHYCGGTIMGMSPLTSVVDENLLVHGTTNVRILSTSVVLYGTSTDSSAVSSMVGNLGAHILLQTYSP